MPAEPGPKQRAYDTPEIPTECNVLFFAPLTIKTDPESLFAG